VTVRPALFRLVAAAVLAAAVPAAAGAVPVFARRYGVACGECHVAPPKLNAGGEAFLARGYALAGVVPRRTWPFAVWVSGRAEALPNVPEERVYANRIELISGGRVGGGLWYFLEWRALSLETRSDGTLRDRSGRFEDLFVVGRAGRAEATVGQFRLINQVDVSRRLGLAEPLVLAASLAGTPAGTARRTALRAFSPAGRSPALRVAYGAPLARQWHWTASAAVPLAGELSLPLSAEAGTEASNELEWRAKGVLLETFARRGLLSLGGHVFYDHGDRFLAHALATGHGGWFYWTAAAGAARQAGVTRGRWSLEAEYLRWSAIGGGVRVEDQAADALRPAIVLYLNTHFPGTRYTMRLTVEQRIQAERHATFVELGAVF
jgi:hypothetical protein